MGAESRKGVVKKTQEADLRAVQARTAALGYNAHRTSSRLEEPLKIAARSLLIRSLLYSLLLAPCCGLAAQSVYKSTMPDGKVVYAEKPAPGAKHVEKIEPPPAQTGTSVITPKEKARAEQLSRPAVANAAASRARDIENARNQVEQAEAAREAGKEPLPGERLGLKGGGSRLTDAYQERQKSLDDAVTAARKRLNDLQR
jgi:hypothetical protein